MGVLTEQINRFLNERAAIHVMIRTYAALQEEFKISRITITDQNSAGL